MLQRVRTAPIPRVCFAALIALACFACQGRDLPASGNIATPATGWYRGDLHYHTNYSGDALSQGGDDLGLAIAIADAYRDPRFLATDPVYQDNGLDYIAITDHRTDAALSDPAFGHDRLIVVPGEEYGGSGHANIFGLKAHINHQPGPGQSQDQRHREAAEEAHAQGAVFSVNHPCFDNHWVYDMERIDSLEVWNGVWSMFWGESTQEDLDEAVRSRGAENPYIRDAIASRGGGPNAQALQLWYNLLSRGRHVALVGGSDRHMIVPAGLPTTYVRKPDLPEFQGLSGKALGWEGIVAGIRARGTFVSRSPIGAQVTLEAIDPAGRRFPIGAKLPGPGTYTLRIRVGRAAGGLLRLIAGPLLPGTGPVQGRQEVVFEQAITSQIVSATFTWVVPASGGWIHAMVLEPLVAQPLPAELEPVRELTGHLPEGNSLISSLALVVPLIDIDVLLDGSKCDVAQWKPGLPRCMPVDNATGGTFYIPDALVRLLNRYFEDGAPTPYCVGAISSAFLALP